jgi:hypothetical protein
MGTSMSSTNFQQQSSFFSFLSFCSTSGAHPSVPTRGALMAAARRGSVKDGRRAKSPTRKSFPGHSLTGPSTAAGSGASGLTPGVFVSPAASEDKTI